LSLPSAPRVISKPFMWKRTLPNPRRPRDGHRLEEAVYALATYPNRCTVAPEARKLRRELRHLLYGKKPHVYRVIYEVDERRQTVWVLTIRHGARRKLTASDVK
jgi:mRNA-degrading endonuclease RelE of RelBE toxin-antitoxin system